MFVAGFAVCVCERKGIDKTSKMIQESILKSIQNRCGNDAQKNDAKVMEHGAKMDPKR